ncbi:hypothetical protein [Salinimonas lutimaris]|uniref:hypothetical protein n=1 Tax=Salinimonas lutimaris TaxID=914153 RepID=UPI0010C0E54A|nr:hypothetical protein [Salinimonas lutimaris]
MSKWILLFSLIMLSPSQVTGQVAADAHDKRMTLVQIASVGDVATDTLGDSDLDGNTVAATLSVTGLHTVSEPAFVSIACLPVRYQAGPQIRAPPFALFA